MESASIAAPRAPASPGAKEGDKGLKSGGLEFISNVVIGVASTAPGYSPGYLKARCEVKPRLWPTETAGRTRGGAING
jgi:hypothetical protein